MSTHFRPEYEAWGWTPVSTSDIEELERQLGRAPRSVIAVAARCRCGKPQVIVNRPISPNASGRPTVFPTLFWLTSPYLVRAVSVLEGAGWISRMRERLTDPLVAQGMHASHEATARLRLGLCDRDELRRLREASPRQYQVLVEAGVAGMRRTDGVKCLHAHLADYLGRSKATPDAVNPIGRAVAELLLRRGIDLMGESLPATGRVAAVDIGSNSVRLFVGEWQPKGATGESEDAAAAGVDAGWRLRPIHRELVSTRLAAGMKAGGQLEPAAVEKTVAALENFAAKAAELGAAPAVGAATAAVRDAATGGELLMRIWETTGQSVPMITGDQEAELAFLGVLNGFGNKRRPLATIDVGGRSTEIVIGDAAGRIVWRKSMPMGAVRLTEECVSSDPVSDEDLASLRRRAAATLENVTAELGDAIGSAMSTGISAEIGAEINAEIGETESGKRVPLSGTSAGLPLDVAAVGGTATTAAAIQLGLASYDPDAVHESRWRASDVTALIERLAALPLAERRTVKGLEPGRADIIVAGLVILEQCLVALGADDFHVSEADLLQGLIWNRRPIDASFTNGI